MRYRARILVWRSPLLTLAAVWAPGCRAPLSAATSSSRVAITRPSGIRTAETTDAAAALNRRLRGRLGRAEVRSGQAAISGRCSTRSTSRSSRRRWSFRRPASRRRSSTTAIRARSTSTTPWRSAGCAAATSSRLPRRTRAGRGLLRARPEGGPSPRSSSATNDCLACHLSWETLGVPGLMVQSVHPLPDEISYVNGYNTIHAQPARAALGRLVGDRQSRRRPAHGQHSRSCPPTRASRSSPTRRRPLASVEGQFDLEGYPTPYSDVVAQMVLAHQARMTNLITRTGWEARLAAAAPSADATRACAGSGVGPGRLPVVRGRGAVRRSDAGVLGICRVVRHAGARATRRAARCASSIFAAGCSSIPAAT